MLTTDRTYSGRRHFWPRSESHPFWVGQNPKRSELSISWPTVTSSTKSPEQMTRVFPVRRLPVFCLLACACHYLTVWPGLEFFAIYTQVFIKRPLKGGNEVWFIAAITSLSWSPQSQRPLSHYLTAQSYSARSDKNKTMGLSRSGTGQIRNQWPLSLAPPHCTIIDSGLPYGNISYLRAIRTKPTVP